MSRQRLRCWLAGLLLALAPATWAAQDLVWTNATQFLLLRSVGSLTTVMATTVTVQDGAAVKSLGGVILTRADRPEIQTLADIRRQRIGIPGTSFFGGYQALAYEFQAAGLPLPGSNTLVPLGSHDAVVQAVLQGRVDVGFVRSGIVDRLRDEAGPVLPRLRVVQAQTFAGFPFAVSTRLYPEWPFVALAHVEDDVVRRVAARLLALEASHPAAQAAGLAGFAPPLDYLPVESLARALRLPPYDVTPALTWQDLWDQHPWGVLSTLLALCLLGLLSAVLVRGNRRLGVLDDEVEQVGGLGLDTGVGGLAKHGLVEVAQQRRQAVGAVAGKQVGGFAASHEVGFELRQGFAGLRQRGQSAARLGVWVGQQAFVVALQPQKGLRVAGDNVHQPSARVGTEFRGLGSFAHQF